MSSSQFHLPSSSQALLVQQKQLQLEQWPERRTKEETLRCRWVQNGCRMGAHHVVIFEHKRLFFSVPTKLHNSWNGCVPVTPLRAVCWRFYSIGRISSTFETVCTEYTYSKIDFCHSQSITAIIRWGRKAWRTKWFQKNSCVHLLELMKVQTATSRL